MGLGTYFRLARAGFVLAREGAFSLAEGQPIPPSAKMMVGLARLIEKRDCAARAGLRALPMR